MTPPQAKSPDRASTAPPTARVLAGHGHPNRVMRLCRGAGSLTPVSPTSIEDPAATASWVGSPRRSSRRSRCPVHLQLRGLEHERDDQRHQSRSAHGCEGGTDHDHAVPGDHGGPDDPMQQADRPLGPQALFTVGLMLYGIGTVLSAISPGLGILIWVTRCSRASARRC